MDRRDLFKSFAKPFAKKEEAKPFIVRPPYHNKEKPFETNCINCEGQCAKACEENIIVIQDDKTPKIVFGNSGCTYCDECALACPEGVLKVENMTNILATIFIDTSLCLAWNNTMCFSCKDPCLDDAIIFQGIYKPSINEDCTSCGFCIAKCPTNAISIKEI